MFEAVVGRLINGALWGLGAGVALAVVRGGGAGARPVAKSLMKAYVAVADRFQETVAEARETIDDVRSEVQAEREQAATATSNGTTAARPARRRRT